MKVKRKGILFVISGPSGVGKGTILKSVLKEESNLIFSISATTRPPREGEQDGKDYYFINNEEFKERLARNQFLEWAFVHNNYYGTLEEFIDHRIIEGIDVVMDIDVQGARKVMKKREDAIFIFIAPPGLDTNVLRQRLEGRNTEDIEQINQRIATAEAELKAVFEYRYLIINNTIDEAVKDLKAVIRAARCQSRLYENSF